MGLPYLCMLTPLSIFAGITTELTVIMGKPLIEVLEGELMWLQPAGPTHT